MRYDFPHDCATIQANKCFMRHLPDVNSMYTGQNVLTERFPIPYKNQTQKDTSF